MQLTKDYQLISSITLTYGACRTYARYLSQDKAENQKYINHILKCMQDKQQYKN